MLSDLQKKIPCTLVRGGTSKGVIFLNNDLPLDLEDKFSTILSIMGAPDLYKNQVDGLGGGKSTNNKVGIINKSTRDGIDIDYLFCQLSPESNKIDIKPNCGNFIAAVPFYAIYKGLVPFNKTGSTEVKIFNINTNQVIYAKVSTDQNGIITNGQTLISGITGAFSEIQLDFFDVVGSKTGKLLPTNNKIDIINGVKCSILDVSVPLVILDGNDLGIATSTDLHVLRNKDFINRLQEIRQKASNLFNFGDITSSVVPKMSIVCKSDNSHIKSFYYDPFRLHDSHAVTGAMCLASACLIDGTVPNLISKPTVKQGENKVTIEHISGTIDAIINFDAELLKIYSAAFTRTAKIIMDGTAFVY